MLSDVLTVFLRALFALQRRRARKQGMAYLTHTAAIRPILQHLKLPALLPRSRKQGAFLSGGVQGLGGYVSGPEDTWLRTLRVVVAPGGD